jgi:hypothetical protein
MSSDPALTIGLAHMDPVAALEAERAAERLRLTAGS